MNKTVSASLFGAAFVAALLTAAPQSHAGKPANGAANAGQSSSATPAQAAADWPGGRKFDQVFIIILENQDAADVLQDPYMKELARRGAYLANYHGVGHPSYPNYLALTGGSTFGATSNAQKNLDVSSIADLLEAKGLGWAQFAEDYPGGPANCFTGDYRGRYGRKHAPFLSYTPITRGPRCLQHVADASNLPFPLPSYSLFVPNMDNDGHDTSIAYASNWLKGFLEPLLARPELAKTLVVVTFDESKTGNSPVYTVFLGSMIRAGTTDDTVYDHYNLLRTVEDNFQLGDMGREDAKSFPITAVWK
ncbi:MAG: hypothetical protein HZA03_01865 [Nitrospinae bacterium]|nr:hypothetical protein [Nitrospinota bacterium]